MAKPVIFLIHGMGSPGPGWHNKLVNQLNGYAQKFSFFKKKNKHLKDIANFVPVSYNDIFDKAIKNWSQTSAELAALSDQQQFLGDLLKWIKGASPKTRDFILTHAMDVILYRFYDPTRFTVRNRVIRTMAEKIHKVLSTSANTPISVLAHSLGTSVAHDSIHHLGTHDWAGVPTSFGPNLWRFSSITTLANVSRILESDVEQSKSVVRPGKKADPGSYCDVFLNFRHKNDPIPWPKTFSADGFPTHRTMNKIVRHFHGVNTHSFDHYLVNPVVHVNLFKFAISPEAVTPDEEIKALENFKTWGGVFAQPFEELRDDFDQIKELLEDDPTPLDFAKAITMMTKVVADRAKELGV